MKWVLALPVLLVALALLGVGVLVLAPLIAALGPWPWVIGGCVAIGSFLSKMR